MKVLNKYKSLKMPLFLKNNKMKAQENKITK